MTESETHVAMAREDMSRYLAACHYQPESAFAQEGVFTTLSNAAAALHPDLASLARKLGEAFDHAGVDDLLLDYTRLFLGPMHILAKPYGSVWLEGDKTLMDGTSLAVAELYREGGFDIDEDCRELPDHVAVELEFLYLLIFRENEARLAGDADRLGRVTDLKARFLDQHLGRWIRPFTSAVRDGAQSGFYRHLADLTRLFVDMETSRRTR